MRFTTQKAALCHALLNGERLTIMEAFAEFGITNLPREIGRSIERSFGVTVNKFRSNHVNKYGESGTHYVYRLAGDKESMYHVSKDKRPAHRKGLKLMQQYVDAHTIKEKEVITPGWLDKEFLKRVSQAAEKRCIKRNGLTTQQIINNSLKLKKK